MGVFSYYQPAYGGAWAQIVTETDLQSTTTQLVACDGWSNAYRVEYGMTWGYSWDGAASRHFDGANALFADGHVKWCNTGPRPPYDNTNGCGSTCFTGWVAFPFSYYTWAND